MATSLDGLRNSLRPEIKGPDNSDSQATLALFDDGPDNGLPRPVPFSGLLVNKLLTALPGDELERLLPYCEPVLLKAGQELRQTGTEPQYAYFPESAVFSLVFFLEDGSSNGAALVGNDGMVGLSSLLNSKPPSYWTHVTIGGTAIRVKLSALQQEFLRAGATQKLILAYTSVRMAQISQRAVCNARHTLAERLGSWLLMVQDRTTDQELQLTHEQIAADLGARRAGITSACNALRYHGIINYHRGRIRIVDRDRLKEAACECYGALAEPATVVV